MINAYIIYQKICEKEGKTFMSHLEFRKDIARDLLQNLREELGVKSTKIKRNEALKRKAEEPILSFPLKQCKLGSIPKNIYRMTTRYSCQLHKKEDLGGKRAPQTSFWCEVCQIPLCRKICFDKHFS